MPEPAQRNSQTIALALLASVVMLSAMAVLTWTGTLPFDESVRQITAIAFGVAAFADLVVAIWFFRKGQSS
jgi:hypothetical protein